MLNKLWRRVRKGEAEPHPAEAVRLELPELDNELKLPIDPEHPEQGQATPQCTLDVKLLAIDLDGTLLRKDKSLSKRNAQAIRAAHDAGVRIVLATARPPRSVDEIHRKLGLSSVTVNYNGALIHDPVTRKHVFHKPLPSGMARKVVELARKMDPDIRVSFEILDKWYTDDASEQKTETAKAFAPDYVGELESFIDMTPTKLMLFAPAERLGAIHVALKTKFEKDVAIVISDTFLLQVVHRQVDKGYALNHIAHSYGIDRQHVLAIGDAPNDLGMIRWAGIGCAVGNAWDSVKEAASVQLPSNDQDAVAHAIESLVLK